MKLRTEIERTPLRQLIGCREGVLLIGSCFTDNIGSWLSESWLPVMSNPWGVLFNPASIAASLRRIQALCSDDACPAPAFELHEMNGRFYSFGHHGRWSGDDAHALQHQLHTLDQRVSDFYRRARHLVITLGTSWVYEREGRVVANCHKFSASEFVRRRLSVDEIADMWSEVIEQSAVGREMTEPLHFVFTVSPIRHVKDTLHGNQLSKATLLLAIDELQHRYPQQVEYLPVYELLNDDLRDYRFYADDLVHPSTMAISMVRELVSECAMDDEMRRYLQEASPIIKALQHRPSNPEDESYRKFVSDTLQRKDALLSKYHIPLSDFDCLNLEV